MNNSKSEQLPAQLLGHMQATARQKFGSLGGWAHAAGLPRETLSRLKSQSSCDLRTLTALAAAAGFTLTVAPAAAGRDSAFPQTLTREMETRLLELAASGSTDSETWRRHGPPFFMGGLAVMLASARGFDREKYLRLAEELHPGVTNPEVFERWLAQTPLRAARFLPMARQRKGLA